MNLPDKIPELPAWAWAAIGFGAVYVLLKPKDAAAGIGKAISDTATGLFTGAAEGLFGIPQTDEAKCQAALAANNGTEAGKYCPAGTLIAAIPQSFADWYKSLTFKPTRPSSHAGYASLQKGDPTAPPVSVLEPGILTGPSFDNPDAGSVIKFDLQGWIEQSNAPNKTINPSPQITPVAGLRG